MADPSREVLEHRLKMAFEHRIKGSAITRFGKEYLTKEGMAHILGVSERTLRQYRHDAAELEPFSPFSPTTLSPTLRIATSGKYLFTPAQARKAYRELYFPSGGGSGGA